MKKRLVLALAVVSISASATVALAGMSAGTGINGSWHDLNSVANANKGYSPDSMKRTCVFCHTPHNARTGADGGAGMTADAKTPLWNHADTTVQLTAYSWVSPANDARWGDKSRKIAFDTDPLIGPSRLCMACHDGNTAVDAHGSADTRGGIMATQARMAAGKNAMKNMDATYTDALGATAKRYITDLQVTHPIGFKYDDAYTTRGPKELVPSSTGFISGTVDSSASWDTNTRSVATEGKKISDTMYNGFMTCASCHDVHNTLNVADTNNTYNYFLYAREEGSAICLSCHVK